MNATRKCLVTDCLHPARTAGMCSAHYERKRTGRDIQAPLTRRRVNIQGELCSVQDCDAETAKTGMCNKHYLRKYRTGSPVGSRKKTLEERFWDKVYKDDKSGCWLWTGSTTWHGYGQFRAYGQTQRAHRVSWKIAGHTLPEFPEFVLDHICFVRSCVNPDHLRVLSNKENSSRHPGTCDCAVCRSRKVDKCPQN